MQVMIEMTLNTNINEIYYAALGGEIDKLTTEEFMDLLELREIELLNTVKNKKDVFLHMCKERVELSRYKNYPANVVNWALHENDLSFEQAKEFFTNKVFLGGFDDRSGVLVEGTNKDIKQELSRIIKKSMIYENEWISTMK
ncbi:hypothetical protein [Enterococcus sp. DIV1420a]|uniref:hypothetical protein n=1 Tax=Enterococcus sp. DIV1420a TaxID=2774672 RepID=UPI003F268E2C